MHRFISFLLIFVVVSASARQITPEEAQSIASEFFNGTSKTRRPMQTSHAILGNAGIHPYYIFNAEDCEGFVIISGDTRSNKILGYSANGHFDTENIPPQLSWLLGEYVNQLSALSASVQQDESWQNSNCADISDGIILETANWGQDYPYNLKTPEINGEHCLTGCVATAMAIIMDYHNWPQKYEWAQMSEENISSGNTSYIAGLMSDIGKSIYTTYDTKESTALKGWPMHKFRQEFHYSPDCQRIFRKNYTDEEWREIIARNIDNKCPILYTADDLTAQSAHAFIIDGYNADMQHINWGWDGKYNGFYNLDALTVNYSNYSDNHEMIVNIYPDISGIEYSECFTDGKFYGDLEHDDIKMNISVENIQKNVPFDIINSRTFCPEGFEGSIALALVGENNKIKEILSSSEHEFSTWHPYEGIYRMCAFRYEAHNVTVSTDVANGDRIQFVAKRKTEKEYKLMLGTEDWPSWVSLNNNVPVWADITFNIDKGVTAKIWSTSMVEETLPEGTTELQVLLGENVNCAFYSNNPMIDGAIILHVDGFDISPCSEYVSNRVIDAFSVGGVKSVKASARLVELTEKSIHLDSPGVLKNKVDVNEALGISKLTISGKMDATDFYFIRGNMPSLRMLDISQVGIETVDVVDDIWNKDKQKKIKCPENVIPFRALCSLANLESVKLPSTITEIMEGAFLANNLKHIVIPSSVSKIGLGAFDENYNLGTVEIESNEPIALNHDPFSLTPYQESTILYVPNGSRNTFSAANIWRDFSEIKEGSVLLVESISFSKSEIDLTLNQMDKLEVTVLPVNASNKKLEWHTAFESVAYVDEASNIYPYMQGEYILVARATDGSGVQATCKIRINEESGVNEISINQDDNVRIFNLTGILMYSGKYADASLYKGLYIVQSGDKTFKHLIK